MAQLCARAIYTMRSSFHFNSAISGSDSGATFLGLWRRLPIGAIGGYLLDLLLANGFGLRQPIDFMALAAVPSIGLPKFTGPSFHRGRLDPTGLLAKIRCSYSLNPRSRYRRLVDRAVWPDRRHGRPDLGREQGGFLQSTKSDRDRSRAYGRGRRPDTQVRRFENPLAQLAGRGVG